MQIAVAHYFPFRDVKCGSSVILYGMGVIGRQYLSQLLATKYCNVPFTVDQRRCGETFMGIPIFNPEEITNDESSLIVVSVESTYIQSEILNQLKLWDIPKERIVCNVEPYVPQVVSWVLQRADVKCEELALKEYLAIQRFHSCLKTKNVVGKSLVRLGNNRDGGYLMVDDFDVEGIAYSFGIGTNVTWEEDIADHGYDVYMYDHTIGGICGVSEKCHFFRIGLADTVIHGDDLTELDELLSCNGHKESSRMILKIDIEGAEWGFLKMVSHQCLEKFDQIVLELHGLCQLSTLDEKIQCLEKINKGHQVIHVHPNNNGKVIYLEGKAYCDLLEVTYANRNRYEFQETRTRLPHELDYPCLTNVEEVMLDDWNNPDYYLWRNYHEL